LSLSIRVPAVLGAALAILAILSQPAAASFGTPSIQPALDGLGDYYEHTQTAEQRESEAALTRAHGQAVKAMEDELAGLVGQIQEKMAGAGSVSVADLAPVTAKLAAFQDRRDALELDFAVAARALLTPSQLVTAASRYQALSVVRAQTQTVLRPTQKRPNFAWEFALPDSDKLYGDHFADTLVFDRGATLTQAQAKQAQGLLSDGRDAIKPLIDQLERLRTTLDDKLDSADALDPAELTALQQQASSVKSQIDLRQFATTVAIRAMLSPAQLAEAASRHARSVELDARMAALLKRAEPPK
jgi:hypothetical protein